MIYYSIPYDVNKNIGKYYNSFMSLLPSNNDWACFIDGDAIFTTSKFGTQLNDIINKYQNVGVFVAVTNRIGCSWQKAPEVNADINDMSYHREIGNVLYKTKYNLCEDVTYKTNYLSGVMFLIKKSVWEKIGRFKDKGILGVDNDLHIKCQNNNILVYKMEGVYVYHWYRNNINTINHLI